VESIHISRELAGYLKLGARSVPPHPLNGNASHYSKDVVGNVFYNMDFPCTFPFLLEEKRH